jgi:hydrogenase-4 transcriptional activator
LPSFIHTLVQVWQEACRHIEIRESVESIEQLLEEQLPLGGMLVGRIDQEYRTVETVAYYPPDSKQLDFPKRTTYSIPTWKQFLRWSKTDQVSFLEAPHSRAKDAPNPLEAFSISSDPSRIMVGPLKYESKLFGLWVLVASPGKAFQETDLELAQLLLKPIAVALENDHRRSELNALREAAEADRRTLLSRLGRQDINEAVVGSETGLRLVMERVELVSNSDVPVLILGETGTGKEVVARAIHTRSKRNAGPFIKVNCGAIPTELIDSQLFGHEKGSFTGASDQRKGWFERAEGGTLFLDEIGELPLQAQVRLLRVLQDHHIERVGGEQSIHVDVRIIAATHRDLANMVKQAQFREDLWYRINVFPILLPRLKERIEDIPALVRHLSKRAADRFQLSHVEAKPSELAMLMNYSWPGNIRELGAVVDRAVILGNGRSLEVATALGLSKPAPPRVPDNEPTFYEVIPDDPPISRAVSSEESPIMSLDDAMTQHIERALAATRGKIEGKNGAAELLGINPHTLRARMRKHKLDWSKFR